MSTVIDLVALWLPLTVTGLIFALNLIAPLTKSDLDNRALSALRWFEDKVISLLLPAHKKALRIKISSIKIPDGVDPDLYVAKLLGWYEERAKTPPSP